LREDKPGARTQDKGNNTLCSNFKYTFMQKFKSKYALIMHYALKKK